VRRSGEHVSGDHSDRRPHLPDDRFVLKFVK
jgi:hypothetical protein